MQESKQRKNYRKTVSPLFSDDKNIPRASRHHNHSRKKTYFAKKRTHEEAKTKVKKSRKWRTFNHATLKHTHCASNYVGSERLTKQVGFLTKGKISDSISRLEKIIPSNLKARANQDLHRILKSANQSQHYMPSSFSDDDSLENSSPNCSNPCNEVNNSPMKCFTSPPRQQENFISKINKMAQTTSSLLQENCSVLLDNDFHVSALTVTDTLYPVIANTNKQIFKEISNLGILRKELLSIKMRYHLDKKTPSSSSNNDSSQDVLKFSDDNFELNPILTQEECPPEIFKKKFELNPILTQRTPKDLMHLFPGIQNNSLSSIDEAEKGNEDDISSHSMESNVDYNFLEQKSCSSSDFDDKHMTLVPQTPSSNGSPAWVPVVSPIKFEPNFAPTPKLYYRQRMF